MEENKGQLIIYQSEDGQTQVNVKMHDETVWLTQDAIVKLFNSSKANISEHISHIYDEGELDKNSTVRKFRTVRKEGNRNVSRDLEYYNLDLILSVGYRVKSKIATKFRIWATKTLKEYITKGYVLNEQRLKEKQEQIETLKSALSIIERGFKGEIQNLEQAQQLNSLMKDFALGLNLLDDFDHKTLDIKGKTEKEAVKISTDEFLEVVNNMKSEFESDVFANPKDNSFDSSVNQIYQSFGGKDCYPTLEEKASMLLYFIVKNHSFTDGNKRIGASCFLYFLDKNSMLYNDGKPIIDNGTLFALTLLIAESKPDEMETVKNMVISVLNRVIP
ncbi:MAG: virulence protein RhuM/Fic/DOC family protein [Brachyspira sp.]|nr:virulence protein RhuM/Fic/DOC family protein [Brachyspira sp.]